MELPVFGTNLRRTIATARYGIYAGSCALVMASGTPPASPSMAVGWFAVGWFAAAPVVLHALFRTNHGARLTVTGHALELSVALYLIGASGVELLGQVAVLCTFASANAALFGRRFLPLFAAASVVALGWGNAPLDDLRVLGYPAVDLFSLAWILVFCIGAGLVAHRQAHGILRSGMKIKSTNLALLRYLPREIEAHLRHRGPAPIERHWLTVAFVDLVGFTEATRTLPAESLSVVLNDYFGRIDAHVRDWGGSVSKFLGDGMLVVFASDTVEERANKARQCTRCVSSVATLLQQLNTDWREQGLLFHCMATSGVASGYCSVGEWGGAQRKDFTIIGPAVNLAARLQQAASPAEPMMDETTAALVGATREGREMELKGIGQTLVYHIT